VDKHELAKRLAKQSHQSPGKAADAVDRLVYRMLKELKRGLDKPAKLPSAAPSPRVSSKGK